MLRVSLGLFILGTMMTFAPLFWLPQCDIETGLACTVPNPRILGAIVLAGGYLTAVGGGGLVVAGVARVLRVLA